MEDAGLLLFADRVAGPAHQRPVVQLPLRPIAEQAHRPVAVKLALRHRLDLCGVVKGPAEGEIGGIGRHLAADPHLLLLGHPVHFDPLGDAHRWILYVQIEGLALHIVARAGDPVRSPTRVVPVGLLPHLLQHQVRP